MPYRDNAALPPAIRGHLPAKAQSIYREAFNGAWAGYGASPRREEIAHRVAWAAVKKSGYRKAGAKWVRAGRAQRSGSAS